MRKRLLSVTLVAAMTAAGMALGAAPASAHRGNIITFTAPVPGLGIPYNGDACLGCAPNDEARKTIRDNTGQDVYNHVLDTKVLYETCNAPFPAATFDQKDIPLQIGSTLELELYPQVDWDGWGCALRGPNQQELDLDDRDGSVRWRIDIQTTNVLGDPCDNLTGVPQIPIGCLETGNGTIAGGTQAFKFVAYNWSDPFPTVEGSWHY